MPTKSESPRSYHGHNKLRKGLTTLAVIAAGGLAVAGCGEKPKSSGESLHAGNTPAKLAADKKPEAHTGPLSLDLAGDSADGGKNWKLKIIPQGERVIIAVNSGTEGGLASVMPGNGEDLTSNDGTVATFEPKVVPGKSEDVDVEFANPETMISVTASEKGKTKQIQKIISLDGEQYQPGRGASEYNNLLDE